MLVKNITEKATCVSVLFSKQVLELLAIRTQELLLYFQFFRPHDKLS